MAATPRRIPYSPRDFAAKGLTMPEQLMTIGADWVLTPAVHPTVLTLDARPQALIGGGPPQQANWSRDLANSAVVTFDPTGVTLAPISTDFLERAQVYHGFATVPGARYHVDVQADPVPASGFSILLFDLTLNPSLFAALPIATTAPVSFTFVARGWATCLFLRVDSTTGAAKVTSVAVDAADGDRALHTANHPAALGRLIVARGIAGTAPSPHAGLALSDAGPGSRIAATLSDFAPGGQGERIWCRWDGPARADLWISWRER